MLSLILVFFAFLVATYAKSQGQSFLLWFLVSCLFTPLLGFIGLVVYLKISLQ
ncbi:hypothetical protein QSV37_04100 [Acinetobacter sp. VNK23]|uniref:hypothetical protein n=1 Tax=Acinetobacter thutiue TaxID=2998078 RepID=UPI002575FEFF|nr:hypothetical protein [Acinetobacter thutiue]MDM1019495.1 hypothetical protein [Acinetobacter thutiue]